MQQFYTENEGEIAQENVDQHVCRCVYLCNAGRQEEEGWEQWGEEGGLSASKGCLVCLFDCGLGLCRGAHSAYD